MGEEDALLELYGDVFASSLLDEQPIFDATKVRALYASIPEREPAERVEIDAMMNRVLSMTLMHNRFGMSA